MGIPVLESALDLCCIKLFAVNITSTSLDSLPVIATACATADCVAIDTSVNDSGVGVTGDIGMGLILD